MCVTFFAEVSADQHAANASRGMLKSILLCLESAEQATPVIDFGVALAKTTGARVRGLTLVDTRRFEEAQVCESAVYLSMVSTRHAVTETIHEGAHKELSRLCLKAKLDFDVRRTSGNPLEVLPAESRFHDLTIISIEKLDHRLAPGLAQVALSLTDMLQLLRRGMQPLLVMPARPRQIERVLLVYDGTEASGRAIRSFLSLGVMREAECRLLAIGRDENQSRLMLAEMAEYCASHIPGIEMGYAAGKVRRVLMSYAKKWEADMLVLGAGRSHGWVQRLAGRASLDMATALECALFVHT